MGTVVGVICMLFGGAGWIAQLISSINYPFAQRLGLQEKVSNTDPLFRQAEVNTAIWDSFVLWTLMIAGILMLTNSRWWPYMSLVAGGIYLDAAGREVAKYMSLLKCNVKVGNRRDIRIALCAYFSMAIIGLWVILYSIWFINAKRIS